MADYLKRSGATRGISNDYSNTANDRVIYNLSKAESLLDEPDGAFRFGDNSIGRPATGNYQVISNNRIGTGG